MGAFLKSGWLVKLSNSSRNVSTLTRPGVAMPAQYGSAGVILTLSGSPPPSGSFPSLRDRGFTHASRSESLSLARNGA